MSELLEVSGGGWVCPRTNQSSHAYFEVRQDILMGVTWRVCTHESCRNDPSFAWPTECDREHALFRALRDATKSQEAGVVAPLAETLEPLGERTEEQPRDPSEEHAEGRQDEEEEEEEEEGEVGNRRRVRQRMAHVAGVYWDARSVALAMVGTFARALAWDAPEKKWRLWNGVAWEQEVAKNAGANELLAREMRLEVSLLRNALAADVARGREAGVDAELAADLRDAHDACGRLLFACGQLGFVSDVRKWLVSHLAVKDERWNANVRGALPLRNGMLTWIFGGGDVVRFEPHRPDLWVRAERVMPVEWRGDGWRDARLDEALAGWFRDAVHAESWLQVVAYALSRTAAREVFVTVVGPPSCGKSSFFRLLKAAFGSEAVLLREDCSLLARPAGSARGVDAGGGGHDSNALACRSRALAVFCEPNDGDVLRQARVKAWTGDDASGRQAHSGVVRDVPRMFTPFIVGNVIPQLEDASDHALRRRHVVLEMGTVFSIAARNAEEGAAGELPAARPACVELIMELCRSEAAASALLARLCAAWRALVAGGLEFPETARAGELREEYWRVQAERTVDHVQQFIAERLEFAEDAVAVKAEVYGAYVEWSVRGSAPYKSEVDFYRTLKRHLVRLQQQSGVRIRLDVRLSRPPRPLAFGGISVISNV